MEDAVSHALAAEGTSRYDAAFKDAVRSLQEKYVGPERGRYERARRSLGSRLFKSHLATNKVTVPRDTSWERFLHREVGKLGLDFVMRSEGARG